VGYELAIRPRVAGKTLPARELVDRLKTAAATGMPGAPSGAAAAPAVQPAAAASPASEAPAAVAPAPSAPAALETVQPRASETSEPDLVKAGPWTLANGKARLIARLYRADGEVRGVDLEVPFGGAEEELRRALEYAMTLADQLGALVFDPQLGREVVRSSIEDVVARWRQSQAWAADVTGEVSDERGVLEVKPPPPLLSRRAKAVLLIVAGFIVLYVLLNAIMDLLSGV
jgi:hypothetical protein